MTDTTEPTTPDGAPAAPKRRSTKLASILAGLLLAGLTLLTYTQTWVHITVEKPAGGLEQVTATGSAAAPALSALSLAGLALFGAITIAGPVFRVVLGALEILLGACVVLSAILATTDPVGSASGAITKITGVDGDSSVREIVRASSMTAWPWVALGAGVLMVVLGLAVVMTSRSWPAATRRYQAVRLVAEDGTTDPVVAWDTLSTGADPTEGGDTRPDRR